MSAAPTIPNAVQSLVDRHGSLRAAARVIGVNYAYLSRLRNSQKIDPSDEVLRKIGLRRITVYQWRKQ